MSYMDYNSRSLFLMTISSRISLHLISKRIRYDLGM